MAPTYMSDHVKLLLILTVLLIFVISTASMKQCTSKKMEGDGYVIKNIGVKMCQLKCAEYGQCASIEYDTQTLTCRLSRSESRIEKKEGHVVLARSNSHVPTGSCIFLMCSFGERCLKTRSGKELCVQASTDPGKITVSPGPVTTQESDPHASTIDASEDLTSSKTVPPAPVTTQDSDPHATLSQARVRDLFDASEEGNMEKLEQIMAVGHVNINSRGSLSRTPVMVAAQRANDDVVEFLVGKGADVSLVDMDGSNALHLACQHGDLVTVKLILSLNKVDVNARNEYGMTAADYARRYGRQELLDLLVSRDAN